MSDILLRTEGLAKSFTLHLRGGLRVVVLAGIDLVLRRGECVALSGPSGAGKSTLMRSIYGNYRVDGGRILVQHANAMIDVAGASPRTMLSVRQTTLGYVSQFLRVVPRVPALDVVAEASGTYHALPDSARNAAAALLMRLNVPPRLHALPPATFSGGEQQRVNLARGIIGGHPVLLLDEPTSALDAVNRSIVIQVIRGLKSKGVAILGIFHDTTVQDAVADRLFTIMPLRGTA